MLILSPDFALGPKMDWILSQGLNFLSCSMSCQESMNFALEVFSAVP